MSKTRRGYSFGELSAFSFALVYPPTDLNVVDDSEDSVHTQFYENYTYNTQLLTRVMALLGFRTSRNGFDLQSIKNILYNLYGWNPEDSTGKKVFKGLLAPVILAFNLIKFIPNFATNLVKIFTEFLPHVASSICEGGAELAKHKLVKEYGKLHPNLFALTGYGLSYAITQTAALVWRSIYFLGRAATSPITGARTALRDGYNLGKTIAGEDTLTGKIVGGLTGCFFLAASVTATIGVYILIYPIVSKFVTAKLLGYATSGVQAVLNTIMHGGRVQSGLPSGMEDIMNPILKGVSAVGNGLMRTFSFYFNSLPFSLTGREVGLAFLTTVAKLTVGVTVASLTSEAINWYDHSRTKMFLTRQGDKIHNWYQASTLKNTLGSIKNWWSNTSEKNPVPNVVHESSGVIQQRLTAEPAKKTARKKSHSSQPAAERVSAPSATISDKGLFATAKKVTQRETPAPGNVYTR